VYLPHRGIKRVPIASDSGLFNVQLIMSDGTAINNPSDNPPCYMGIKYLATENEATCD